MIKIKLPAPLRTGLAWWDALGGDKKYEVLVPYFEAGKTDVQIAYVLEIRPAGIRRFRNRYDQKVHPELFRHGRRIKKKKRAPPKVVNMHDRKPYRKS